MTHAENFDPSRLSFGKKDRFPPFHVKKTIPYQQALSDGTLDPEEAVLVMPHADQSIVVTRWQIAYHHHAQGDINGEAWMISF